MFEKQTVRTALVAVLRQVQEASGRPCPAIKDNLKPIGDLPGFDSLLAVEATVLLEQKLGCRLATGTPFISESGMRALSIDAIIERTLAMAMPGEAA
jgi:acyl carrier protein